LAAVTGAAMESKRREEFNELMAMIVNSIPDAVHSVDTVGRITAINLAARRMYGYADTEIVGLTNEVLLPAGRRDEIRRMYERALGGEIVPRFPTLQIRSDGTEIAVSMTMIPMRHEDGSISNVAFIATAFSKIREAGTTSARDESHPPRHALVLGVH
jgi:PAS domain S-box-containing protein